MDKYAAQPQAARTYGTAHKPNAPYVAGQASRVPTHEDIARRAYEIYRQSGCRQGQCKQNWRQAEVDLRREAPAAR